MNQQNSNDIQQNNRNEILQNAVFPMADNLITSIIGQIFKEEGQLQGLGPEKPKEFKQILVSILILALFLVVGSEPYKVIVRRNVGKNALSILGIVVAFILFLVWVGILIGALVAAHPLDGEANIKTGVLLLDEYFRYLTEIHVLILAILGYIIFAVYFLSKGIFNYLNTRKERSKDWIKLHFRGESIYMQHLIKKGVSQKKIWMHSEPKLCFRITLILTIINPLIGLPLFLTSLSFWFNEWYHIDTHWQDIEWSTQKMVIDARGNITEQAIPVSSPSSFRIRTDD